MNSADDLMLPVAWVERGIVKGPGLGISETLSWHDLSELIADNRRIGDKDGCAVIPTVFQPEPDNHRKIWRLARNARGRSGVILDVEASKATGEIPPPVEAILNRLREAALAAVTWTTHNHAPAMPRYRIFVPLSEVIDPDLPAVEVLATELRLEGVIDRSKRGPASIFYLPSAACYDDLDHHKAHIISGQPYSARKMRRVAGRALAEREVDIERQAEEAVAESERRRQERISVGADPDASLIDQLRARLDLRAILSAHGYDKRKGKGDFWRHSNSQSGIHGGNIKAFASIERFYSFNGGDPLHPANLPAWCTVKAVDAFDAACILDFGSDRRKAMLDLGIRFGLLKPIARKQIARLIYKAIERGDTDEKIMAAVFTEGDSLGLSRAEVQEVARYIVAKAAA